MKYYIEGSIVEVIVDYADHAGNSIEPTDIKATLYDGEDTEIIDFGSIPFELTAGKKSIMIPAVFNELQNGELQAARILRVEMVTPKGSVFQSLSYVIEAEQRLVIMNNTFQTYEAALIDANNQPNLIGWVSASEEQQKAALIEAFNRITLIPMRFGHPNIDKKHIGKKYIILANKWREVTRDEFSKFPAYFKRALRRAQLIEANEILQGDGISRKRRAGIITEKIGESWLTLSENKMNYGVSSQTLAALTGFIYYRMTTVRA